MHYYVYTLRGPDKEDDATELTYGLLYDKQVSRDEAADLASALLGRTISSEAWRKHIDRWAAAKGLPKVGHRKRQTDKTDK